jgi:acetoin utilization deacetylase AcuC-like enzyme
MQVVYHEAQRRHDPRHFLVNGAPQANPEVPGRIDALLASAKEGGHQVVAPRDHGLAPLAAVHSPEYLAFLETIYTRWQRIDGASAEVVPNIHPDGPGAGYPRSAVGQAGYHMADTACPMTADTWGSTLASAWSAVEGAELILAGARAAYALCRPPGHHAFKDRAGGFCYVNNCAVAATVLRREAARVAILDVDLHHGNGTQGIFYRRDDVLTVSTHADPIRFYPFFWGYAGERRWRAAATMRPMRRHWRPRWRASVASHRTRWSSPWGWTPTRATRSAAFASAPTASGVSPRRWQGLASRPFWCKRGDISPNTWGRTWRGFWGALRPRRGRGRKL